METITIRRIDDMHLHVRGGDLLRSVLPVTVKYAGRAVIMPNTKPRAILNARDVDCYRGFIRSVVDELPYGEPFEPLMTIEVRDSTTPGMIEEARAVGAVAGKVYPRGVTTNSDNGVSDFEGMKETFRAMEEVGMLLLLHGEIDRPRTLVTEREEVFLPILTRLASRFPDLRIVLEHVSTAAAIGVVNGLGENVAATITAHHLCLTLNDVLGDGVRPHNMCMPVPKTYRDREVLIDAATSGKPQFFLGSDSAPHRRSSKECAKGACGVYSAPVLLPVLAEVFERVGRLDRLNDFVSRFGAEFYGLPLNEGSVTLVKRPWEVPGEVGGVVPFRAGAKLQWQIV